MRKDAQLEDICFADITHVKCNHCVYGSTDKQTNTMHPAKHSTIVDEARAQAHTMRHARHPTIADKAIHHREYITPPSW
jgi:hypothetical protein